MSRQSKTAKYAYAAGILDGEGCISIRKIQKNNNAVAPYAYSLTVLVNMTDGEAVDFLRGCFGGNVYLTQPQGSRLPVYRWELRTWKAAEFLKRALPFIRVKKPQAELATRFQEHIGKPGTNSMSEYEREFRHWCYETMKRLKAIHNPSRATVTTEREQSSQEDKRQSELTGILEP